MPWRTNHRSVRLTTASLSMPAILREPSVVPGVYKGRRSPADLPAATTVAGAWATRGVEFSEPLESVRHRVSEAVRVLFSPDQWRPYLEDRTGRPSQSGEDMPVAQRVEQRACERSPIGGSLDIPRTNDVDAREQSHATDLTEAGILSGQVAHPG